MARRDQESQEVMSAAMRYVKYGDRSGLESFSFSLLRKADYKLGNRDSGSGYRRSITDRISELESEIENNASNSHTDVIDVKPNFYGLGITHKSVNMETPLIVPMLRVGTGSHRSAVIARSIQRAIARS